MLSGSSPYIFGVCNTHSSFDQPGQSAWTRQQKGDPTATLCTEKPSPSLESPAIASCIAAKLSGCLTAISIDCRARIPVVQLAKSASSVNWMRWSGCRLTARPWGCVVEPWPEKASVARLTSASPPLMAARWRWNPSELLREILKEREIRKQNPEPDPTQMALALVLVGMIPVLIGVRVFLPMVGDHFITPATESVPEKHS